MPKGTVKEAPGWKKKTMDSNGYNGYIFWAFVFPLTPYSY